MSRKRARDLGKLIDRIELIKKEFIYMLEEDREELGRAKLETEEGQKLKGMEEVLDALNEAIASMDDVR